jgi:hypothetical protein
MSKRTNQMALAGVPAGYGGGSRWYHRRHPERIAAAERSRARREAEAESREASIPKAEVSLVRPPLGFLEKVQFKAQQFWARSKRLFGR